MADLKTVLCVIGALGGLFVVTCNGSVDVPCDSLLSGGVPLEQCLGEYVCHNGTCAERMEKLIACVMQVTTDLLTRCFPGLELPQSTFTDLIQSVSFLNTTFCSGQYWNISSYVESQLNTGGKCTERFHQEYAGCSETFLQKFLAGTPSADLLCRFKREGVRR
uniref:Uncharacterized protein n=1 Tax=Branchiostoma floridae TaxID=7739 RepID=C3YSS6_BRAFL|eukprot:XP_002600765.1 hypothetical protein BRAFLDRAFT_83508 [Branchiostoma floridae]